MAGTKIGGLRAAATNRMRYGEDFYQGIGKLGGQKSRNSNFAKNPEFARAAGRVGGKRSRRPRQETEPIETPKRSWNSLFRRVR